MSFLSIRLSLPAFIICVVLGGRWPFLLLLQLVLLVFETLFLKNENYDHAFLKFISIWFLSLENYF